MASSTVKDGREGRDDGPAPDVDMSGSDRDDRNAGIIEIAQEKKK